MTEIYETQSERTDLPLTVMPCVVADMIEPFKANFEVLRDVTRLRMYTDTTLTRTRSCGVARVPTP